MSLAVSDEACALRRGMKTLPRNAPATPSQKSIHFFHYIVIKFICQLLHGTFFKFFRLEILFPVPTRKIKGTASLKNLIRFSARQTDKQQTYSDKLKATNRQAVPLS